MATPLVLSPASYAILPVEDGLVFDADAEFYRNLDEALEAALDWSIDIGYPVRVYKKKNGKWAAFKQIEA